MSIARLRSGLYAGCSKARSHRALPEFQQFEIPHRFPKFPQIFGAWIVRRIRAKETGKEKEHPCSKSFDTFLDCCRRHPASYEKKCRNEAGKCLACLEEHREWKPAEPYQYMRFLEHFKVFSEGKQSWDEGPGCFRYPQKLPRTHGTGTVLAFGQGGLSSPPKGGGAAGSGGSGAGGGSSAKTVPSGGSQLVSPVPARA
mmetsp:Transcript_43944/g.111245  ORF Transcript_43944/g.111245 Transcript_43944/m.111245 type:complete len:199 (+) Transcript_43944:63-659(+)